jgi:hypothetical protein
MPTGLSYPVDWVERRSGKSSGWSLGGVDYTGIAGAASSLRAQPP